MKRRIDSEALSNVKFLIGSPGIVEDATEAPSMEPFSEDILGYLNDVAKALMKGPRSKAYSDVFTLGFWLRRSSTEKLKARFVHDCGGIRMGRGTVFHIAPSNVPVNFAYSLAAGLLTGNRNIVRVPSKDFPQVGIIRDALEQAMDNWECMRPYVILVRYDRDKRINDLFSGIADTRVVWGGDTTIAELRKSALPPRSTEVTFADRYSLAVIDSDAYMQNENKSAIARDFYNDTYFTDQNACTSPRIVVWVGGQTAPARKVFWEELHALVEKSYGFQPIQSVNKLTSSYMFAMRETGVKIEPREDNLVVRVSVPEITDYLMDYKDNSGYFFEYVCKDILELKPLCDDKRCQTIGLYGDKELLKPLLLSGIKGVDRVVPLGKTMDFDLIWDGYDLVSQLTRIIRI